MTNNKIWTIAWREYTRVVKKRSFWFIVLALPALYVLLGFVSGYSATTTEKRIQEEAKNAKQILIVDDARLIKPTVVVPPFSFAVSLGDAREKVKAGSADAAFVYSADITQSKKIQIIAVDTNLVARGRFTPIATQLLTQSILQDVQNPEARALVGTNFATETTLFKDGKQVATGIEGFIVPIITVVLYFLMIITSSTFMLSSVSEEKENRMIETVLSIVTSRQLVWGKIVGLFGVAITQIATLAAVALALNGTSSKLFAFHIDWSMVQIQPLQIIVALFYLFTGFLFMANIMVGVGAAMPTARDAQQFSSIFIILAILPIYFAYLIIADPSGLIARIVSFTPFTAPMVLLFRSSVGAMSAGESLLGVFVMVIYTAASLFAAIKLFELGSLELSTRISFKNIFKKL